MWLKALWHTPPGTSHRRLSRSRAKALRLLQPRGQPSRDTAPPPDATTSTSPAAVTPKLNTPTDTMLSPRTSIRSGDVTPPRALSTSPSVDRGLRLTLAERQRLERTVLELQDEVRALRAQVATQAASQPPPLEGLTPEVSTSVASDAATILASTMGSHPDSLHHASCKVTPPLIHSPPPMLPPTSVSPTPTLLPPWLQDVLNHQTVVLTALS